MAKTALNRSFYYLLGTQTSSNMADILYTMALTVMVLNQTDSLISATLVPLIRGAMGMISGSVAPLLMARFKLTRLLFVSQLGQFVVFSLLVLYLWNRGDSSVLLPVLLLVSVLSFLDGWTTPSRNSLVPRLVGLDSELLKANGMLSVSDQIVQFAGWGLSGVVVVLIGTSNTMLAAAVIYGLAASLTLRIHEPAVEINGGEKSPARSNRNILIEGWQLIWRVPRLRVLTFMDVSDMIANSVWAGAFLLVYVQQVLKRGDEWWGFINAAYFSGTLLGGIIVVSMVEKLSRRIYSYMLVGMIGYSLFIYLFAFNQSPWLALLFVVLCGPFAELAMVSRKTLLQRSLDKARLPQLFSAQNVLLNLFFCLSLLGMAWIAETFGIVPLFVFAACLTSVTVVIGLLNYKVFHLAEEAGQESASTL
ncbi:MFS transporter [Paenibacillus sp. PAMC21692]|uniref:MFS transporter n=1 Tax=Paenibacillus sp. PAMC21692 TaxID=2762320 RepID=UPI00164ED3E0|nr:MFS transporter [Paenibacillus sp. PAMC21692]QNK55995.1 MFS transporter [Paenibacillus sp. PAMC21692]